MLDCMMLHLVKKRKLSLTHNPFQYILKCSVCKTDLRKEREETLTKKVNKVTLLLRALVSVYVLYLAYGLIKDYGTATNQMLSLAAIAIFVVGGGLILAHSAYKLITKDYDDGSEDDTVLSNAEVPEEEHPETKAIEAGQSGADAGMQTSDQEKR